MSAHGNIPAEIQNYIQMIKKALASGRDITIVDELDVIGEDAAPRILKSLFYKLEAMINPIKKEENGSADSPLPNVIRFPYARHSSLPELRDFVGALKPKDIVPCTFDAELWLQKGWGIERLFGDCCSGIDFEYDNILDQKYTKSVILQQEAMRLPQNSQQSTDSLSNGSSLIAGKPMVAESIDLTLDMPTPTDHERQTRHGGVRSTGLGPGAIAERRLDYDCTQNSKNSDSSTDLQGDSQQSSLSEHAYETRRNAYEIVKANLAGETWGTVGLISTTDHHTTVEEGLGQP